MLFRHGRPRFWISGFDTAHLALPGLLALVVGLLAMAPSAPPAVERRPPPPIAPARTVTAPVILAPIAGRVLFPDQLTVIEGVGPPGAVVTLYWFDRLLGAPTRVAADGRWRFWVQQFPPGGHALRAVARWEEGQAASPPVIFTIQARPSPPDGRTRRR